MVMVVVEPGACAFVVALSACWQSIRSLWRADGHPVRGRGGLRAAAWPLAGVALGLLLSLSPPAAQLEQAWQDFALRRSAPPSAGNSALVIDIDEASMLQLRPRWGAWPYSRQLHAHLTERLFELGADAVVFNIVFADPRDGDAELRAAITRHGRVVLAAQAHRDVPLAEDIGQRLPTAVVWPGLGAEHGPHWPALQLPEAGLLGAAVRVGILSTPLDSDGKLRCAVLVHHVRDQHVPSLVLAALAVRDPGLVSALGPDHHQANGPWETDHRGCVTPRLPARAGSMPSLSLAAVLAVPPSSAPLASLKAQIQGRTVFVGSPSLMDSRALTPMGQLGGTTWQALAFDALRNGQVLQLNSAALNWAVLALALVPTVLFWRRHTNTLRRHTLLALSFVLVILLASLASLGWLGQPITLLPSLLVLTGGLLAAAIQHQHWLATERGVAQQARAVAESASRAKTDFLAHISHEIRTPLNAVLGMGQLLAETPLSPLQKRYVEVFASAGEHLRHLLDNVLDLARIEAGELHLQAEAFAPAALLTDLQSLFEPRAQAKHLAFDLSLGVSLPEWVMGDPHRLRQILINLLGNAIKFTQRGQVELAAYAQADELVFEVKDSGIGIPAQRLKAVFEPFTQADAQIAVEHGGSGLGLAITRRLAQAMGGDVSIQSTPDIGTQVHLRLPMPACAGAPALTAKAAALAAGGAAERGADGETNAGSLAPSLLSGRRLLLAEDNANNVLVIEGLLRDTGALLTVVGDGQAAVLAAQTPGWDLILMDLRMPHMDGLAATRAIRTEERRSGRAPVPVVALSASALASEIKACLNAGCNAYLSKPVDKTRLLATLVAQLGTGSAAAPAAPATTPATTPATEHRAAVLAAPSTPALAFMNQSSALARLGGDQALYARLCQAAQAEFEVWESRFEAALATADAGHCRRLAHDLKSVAASLGAERLAAASGALETAFNIQAGAAASPLSTPPNGLPAALSAELQLVRRHLSALEQGPA